MSNSLSQKFTFRSLISFAIPNIIMTVFLSLYTIVDGMFISRFIGTNALSATNIFFPIVSIEMAIGIMFATGASAVIATKMGEGKVEEARENFTLITLLTVCVGILTSILGIIFIRPLLKSLGASGEILNLCYEYALPLFCFAPLFLLQTVFLYFFVTAGKPVIGLILTVIGGFSNIILDYIFIVPMGMGMSGAAIATGIGYSIPAIMGLIYFSFNRNGSLYFVKPRFDKNVIFKSITNGSSEMITNLSTAVTTFLFNITTMKYLGEDGVASITILLYSQYLFTSIYLGYSSGIAPVISYNFGSNNTDQLKKLFNISIKFLIICSLTSFCLAMIFAENISSVFAEKGSGVFDITVNGFYYFAFGFLFMGINIFASSLFTALSDGKISALLSFVRTFIFIIVGILLLPLIIGVDGIWLSVPVAEMLSVVVSIIYLVKKKPVYKYA